MVYKKNPFAEVRKRDGRLVPFDQNRITSAISRALQAAGEGNLKEDPEKVSDQVVGALVKKYPKEHVPTIEEIQDIVETELILMDFPKTAKAYILYRNERAQIRERKKEIPENVKQLAAESKKYFRSPLSEFVYYRTYSRWIEEEGRRETWIETVDRYINFMKENLGDKLSEEECAELRGAILRQEVMPSMRLLWSAGKAAKVSNISAFNCSYIAPKKLDDFAEILYIVMCGTGCGFSAESQNVQALPQIKRQTGKKLKTFVIEDSKEGWADSLKVGLNAWFNGKDVDFDFSKLRPAGARLKTMGGRSSGPEPLRVLLDFARRKILQRQGSRLSNIDVHDLVCKIAEIVVVGGVRRSALISLSDLDDQEMRDAKTGQFFITEPQRSMANNSAAYNEKPSASQFLEEWLALVKSGTGERGIFNREGLMKQIPERRRKVFERDWATAGANPCVTADTWVVTSEGPKRVSDLIHRPFTAIINGAPYLSSGFWKTGEKEVFEIKTDRGLSLRATTNHPVLTVYHRSRKIQRTVWREIKDLKIGDEVVLHNHQNLEWGGEGTEDEGWLLGSLLGDGNIEKNGKANLDYWGRTQKQMMEKAVALVHATVGARSDSLGHISKTGYVRVQSVGLGQLAAIYEMTYGNKTVSEKIEKASSNFYKGLLRGWFDADGSVQDDQKKGVSVRLNSSNLGNLESAQRMLARLGIISTVYKNRRPPLRKIMPNGRGGLREYLCDANHELIISGENILAFNKIVGFSDPEKQKRFAQTLSNYKRRLNKEKFSAVITEIRPIGKEIVYDCVVENINAFDANGFYVHNCGEIILKSKEFCNLTEVVARPEDTEKTLLNKVRLAAILGTYQSTLTDFPYISKEWRKNCEEERLLGVSITGQWDSPAVRNEETLRKMKEAAVETNRIYAERFGVNQSLAVTCVKPSGCRPWHALTATTGGLFTLEELFINHEENKIWDEYRGRERAIQNPHHGKIAKTYNNGFDRVLRIKMNYGLTVESTPNHQWFVLYHYDNKTKKKTPVNNWVEARNIRSGDVLEVKPGAYSNKQAAGFQKVNSLAIKMRNDAIPIKQPEVINQDLAWLLGYLWGDGVMSPGKFGIRFTDEYGANLKKAQKIIEEQFGLKADIHQASLHRRACTLEVGSKMLWHWLIKNDVFKYSADRIDVIPRCVRASSREDIIAFISGLLDSDGWVGKKSNNNGYTLTLTTADGFFAKHLQDVAWAVGLGFGRSQNTKGQSFQKQKDMHLLTLGRYLLKDAFEVLAKNSNKIREAQLSKDFSGWLWQNEKNNTLIAGKVLVVEEVGIMPTFDIEVENHWYYAGSVKSHNTVSQLVDAASGLHPRHSKYYIRRVRINATDPLFQMLKDQKVPYYPEVGQSILAANAFVFEFPVKAPEGSITKNDLTALEHLEYWKNVKQNYTEHNPSVTISVGSNEWIEVANWLYQNWDILGGLSFLPRDDHVYLLAPYEEISEERYKEMLAKFPPVDFSQIIVYEKEDGTQGAKELACVSGVCEAGETAGVKK